MVRLGYVPNIVAYVRQVLLRSRLFAATHAHAHWREALRVLNLRKVLLKRRLFAATHAHAHWRKALRVLNLRKVLLTRRLFAASHAHAHWLEASGLQRKVFFKSRLLLATRVCVLRAVITHA